jgi:CPA2 family monovalent cation:H+ antiporter-2
VNEALLIETLTLIGASALSIALLSRLGLPAMLGYLLAGIIVGPLGLNIVAASDGAHFLAELGLVLLLFMVGLEFSWAEMWSARRAVFGAGALQVALSIACAALIARALGVPWTTACIVGGAAAMSSTGIALKQLEDSRQLARPHGRLATSLLLFQDVATLPFLVVIDSANVTGAIQFLPALRQLLVAAASLGGLLWLGRPLLRVALTWIGKRKTVDLFLQSALLLALGTAYLAEQVGAAPTIGAFLAGVAVGESDLRHRVMEQLRPFRDVLLGLFFVTVGMQVDARAVAASPLVTLSWLGLFVLAKPALAMFALRIVRYDAINSLRAAVVLAQASEFTLLILTQAMTAAVLPATFGQAMLVAAALSMGLAPLIIQHNRSVAAGVLRALDRLRNHRPASVVRPEIDPRQRAAAPPGGQCSLRRIRREDTQARPLERHPQSDESIIGKK